MRFNAHQYIKRTESSLWEGDDQHRATNAAIKIDQAADKIPKRPLARSDFALRQRIVPHDAGSGTIGARVTYRQRIA